MGRARRESALLEGMLSSYKNARNVGDEEDEAKWANNIGHLYKERGEYKLALQWFTKDYDISMKLNGSDAKKLMPTCQSIGETYLRLHEFEDALVWQKKHFHLAEEVADEPEQQRASTQLGRTYLEMFETKNSFSAVQDATRYLTISLKLAYNLKANPPSKELSPSGFVKELVDAHNNLGLLRMAVEDYTAAEKYYCQGLKICDEEELGLNDDARSRLHHNLGRLYCELRQWEKSKHHTDMDIAICQRIPHAQGEAKGLVNQGILHLRALDFDKARLSFRRALQIAESLQDETQLCDDIGVNLNVVAEAEEKSKQLGVLLQQQKKYKREIENASNGLISRTIIKEEITLLTDIIAEAYAIKSWDVHLGMAKRQKSLAERLGDKEKQGDAMDSIGVSYYNLRNFTKAIKWHLKGWEVCYNIKHLEGQIVAKINLGNCYDSKGDWEGALEAYQEAYRAASSKSTSALVSQKMNALENMHYCYSVRLEQFEDARDVELELQQLKTNREAQGGKDNTDDGRCSETDDDVKMNDDLANSLPQPVVRQDRVGRNTSVIRLDDPEDLEKCAETEAPQSMEDIDMLGVSDFTWSKESRGIRVSARNKPQTELSHRDNTLPVPSGDRNVSRSQRVRKVQQKHEERIEPEKLSVSEEEQTEKENTFPRKLKSSRRKRFQTILSDEEDSLEESENHSNLCQNRKLANSGLAKDSDDDGDQLEIHGPRKKSRTAVRHYPAKRVSTSSDTDMLLLSTKDWKTSSDLRSESLKCARSEERNNQHSNVQEKSGIDLPRLTEPISGSVSGSQRRHPDTTYPLKECLISSCDAQPDELVPSMSVDTGVREPSSVLPEASTKSSECNAAESCFVVKEANAGFLRYDEVASSPRLRHDSQENVGSTEVPVLTRYLHECATVGLAPSSLLVDKLQNLKVSEDEIAVSACNLTDKCIRPLITALQENPTFTVLNLSHNHLGNGTVNDIQQLIKLTNQTDLGLTLDLHKNKLGAGALTQISHCPVFLSRLEVLNLSDNRLTDAAARHLSLLLERSSALATLSLESCGLTTRTIAKISSALNVNSSLTKLCIGRNNSINGYVLEDLLHKISTLQCFSELDLKGLELDEIAVRGICALLLSSRSLSTLNLEGTDISNDGVNLIGETLLAATARLAKLNLSRCRLHSRFSVQGFSRLVSVHSLSYLDLSSNDLDSQAAFIIGQALSKSSCRLKVLNLSRSRIGKDGVLSILKALKENTSLLDLKVAGNLSTRYPGAASEPSGSTEILVGASMEHDLKEDNGSGVRDKTTFRDKPALLFQEQVMEECAEAQFETHRRSCAKSDKTDDRRTFFSSPEQLEGSTTVKLDSAMIKAPSSTEPSCQDDEADQHLKAALCEDLCRTLVPLSSSKSPITNVSCVSQPVLPDLYTCDPYLVDLSQAIRSAKMLRLLDLSQNHLDFNVTDYLYSAWCVVDRGTSIHQKHVENDTVHFLYWNNVVTAPIHRAALHGLQLDEIFQVSSLGVELLKLFGAQVAATAPST